MTRIDYGDFKVFTLHIEGVNIDQISLEDIGQYLTDLSELLGRDASPRYHALKRGSLTIAAKVPREREIDVKTRGFLLRTGDAPEEAVRARQRISKRLGMHHAKKATLLDATRDKIIDIPIKGDNIFGWTKSTGEDVLASGQAKAPRAPGAPRVQAAPGQSFDVQPCSKTCLSGLSLRVRFDCNNAIRIQ